MAPSKAAAEGAPVDAVAAEPPKPVLLWRLGGRNDNQRPAPRQGERRGQQGPRAGQDQANAQPNTNRRPSGDQPQGEGNREARDNRGGPRGGKDGGGGRPPQQQGKRPDHRGGERNERNDRGGERNDRNNRPAAQPTRFEAKPPRKEKPMDPDSPFAKLAALKEQMKK